uniref:Uncharacterized protein n=1 Tax=Triticum urartu TaxID=4572 RepID=A0A8R7UXI8_TRIUA
MAGKDETGKWMLRPCSAAKSTEAGDHGSAKCILRPCSAARPTKTGGHGTATRFPSKRKATAGSSYKEGGDSFDSDKGEAKMDKMLGEVNLPSVVANQPAAAPPGLTKGKVRLSKAEIRSIVALKPEKLPSTDYLDDLAEYFPPEWIEERKRAHADNAELFKKMDDDFEEYWQQVITSVRDKGYFEVDEDFIANRNRANELGLELQRRILSPIPAKYCATPEDRIRDAHGYIPYVPDQDDALVEDLVIDGQVVVLKD